MGSCCSSDEAISTHSRNTDKKHKVSGEGSVTGSGKRRKHQSSKEQLDEESVTRDSRAGSVTPPSQEPEDDTDKKQSIFEQLPDVEKQTLLNNDGNAKKSDSNMMGLGLEQVHGNPTDADISIGDSSRHSDNPDDTIDRNVGIETQPSYADAQAGINQQAHTVKANDFSMLQFISTSPTLRDDETFNCNNAVTELRAALKAPTKERGQKVAAILTNLSDSQRQELAKSFAGPSGASLKSVIKETFSGDVGKVMLELVRSSAENDGTWIREAMSKLNVNTHLLNEIICSRTNEQLVTVNREYNRIFGRPLETALSEVLSKNKSYLSLLTKLLQFTRKESSSVNDKDVKTDIKKLYTWLEETKNWERHKGQIIDVFTTRSWQHINEICNKYTTKSMHDLQVLLLKKMGNNSKTGDALQVIIQCARNRFHYFASLLQKAMKGLGTDDGLLIRTLVSRSGIDLKEILNVFSRDFGEGKTATQWIKGDTHGAYQFIMLSICRLEETSLENEEKYEEETYRRSTIQHGIGGINIGEVENKPPIDNTIDDDVKEHPNWDLYLASSPTIKPDTNFNSNELAKTLYEKLKSKDKKIKKQNKQLVIKIITKLNNRQRQSLVESYKTNHSRSLDNDVNNALGKSGKGKSLIAVLSLLQSPAEHDAIWCRKAIKGGSDWKLLSEILCTRSNSAIKDIINVYNSANDKHKDLYKDIIKLCKKPELKIMLETILQCKRPQTLDTNYNKVKQDVDKLVEKKGKFGGKDKTLLAEILGNNSWAHIKSVSDKYGAYGNKTFDSILKDVFGNNSTGYIVASTIYSMSVNRTSLWCRLLREAMSGLGTDQQLLIRVLVSRSEIDLGEINNDFSRLKEYGNGKTLKQWICDDTKGSFQTLLLRIAGLVDLESDDSEEDAKTDAETSVDESHTGLNDSDGEHSNIGGTSISSQQRSSLQAMSGGSVKSTDFANVTTPKQQTQSSQDSNAGGDQDPNEINVGDMGNFMLKKMTDKTVNKLWQHIDEDGSGTIEANEVLKLLTFTAVLFHAYQQRMAKQSGGSQTKVDKNKIRQSLKPLCDWIGTTKMINDKKTVGKAEFTSTFGSWLNEFYQLQNE